MKSIYLSITSVLCLLLASSLQAQNSGFSSSEEIEKQLSAPVSRTRGATRGFSSPQSFNQSSGRASLGAIQFEYNSTELTDDGKRQVRELATAMQNLSGQKFTIIGHTDASGGDRYNLSLSERRALAVRTILSNQYDIGTSRLDSKGEGETSLLDANNPNSPKNRRVEVISNQSN